MYDLYNINLITFIIDNSPNMKNPFLRLIILFACLLFETKSIKILQLTQKNLPNVLKHQPQILILYHNPQCTYSSNFKQKFSQYLQSPSSSFPFTYQNIGIVDCLQQQHLCKIHNISQYPTLKKITIEKKEFQSGLLENIEGLDLNAQIWLGENMQQYKGSQEYMARAISEKLNKKGDFIAILFEQEGMPVRDEDKIKGVQGQRVFYVGQGRIRKLLGGFVKNKAGCWIFQLKSLQSGQLQAHSCGDTYQSPQSLSKSLKVPFKPDISMVDSSNYQNETILGYKQLLYSLKNHEVQLSISTQQKISICNYIYVWGNKCEHCNYQDDMRVIGRAIRAVYGDKDKEREKDGEKVKFSIFSYDVAENKMLVKPQHILKLAQIPAQRASWNLEDSSELYLIPNLLSICFSTENNRKLSENAQDAVKGKSNVLLDIREMGKIIVNQNVKQFAQDVLNEQDKRLRTGKIQKAVSKEEKVQKQIQSQL